MKGGPSVSSVLGTLGALLVVSTIVAAALDADPYLDSLVQGTLVLVFGGALLALAAHVRTGESDDRSWRATGWVGLFFAISVVELVWVGVVTEVVGGAQGHFTSLTTVSTGLTAGGVVAWYDHRREAEYRERVASQRSYREVFERVSDAILVHDPETGHILDANPSAERLYGRDVSTLQGVGVEEFSVTEDGYDQATAERYIRAAHETGDQRFEWYVELPDGTRRWVDVHLQPATLDGNERVLAVVRDIDERKRRELELRIKDRALDEAPAGITIATADGDNPLVYVNDAFLDITGYDRETVLGKNCRFLQGPDTDPDQVAVLRHAIEETESATVELLNYRADGTPFWNEVGLTPVHDDDGTVTHFLGVQRDVTGRKRREQAFAVLNRVLRHNLRNDLTVVAGHARLFADRLDGRDAERATRVAETADDLAALGEKARELESAVTSDETPHPVDIGGMVRAVAGDLRAAFPDATVTVDVPGDHTAIGVSRVERALYELGENALEHGGSTVRFSVERADEAVMVRIADDGPGIPAMECEVLRTGRETPLRHGTGVGLWLANWIVTDVGGHLDVTDGDDTTVTVTLWAADAGHGQQAAINVD
ncbi:PAS domain S-box protein [Halorarius litoreus]|uniref:PAS domain S-box protein n=1 Tax=Halorarius litoreus TaxID=2962676 RepID=UPI0020CD0F52|nr:PAS domain S-box protein [Halorarius litoreus]